MYTHAIVALILAVALGSTSCTRPNADSAANNEAAAATHEDDEATQPSGGGERPATTQDPGTVAPSDPSTSDDSVRPGDTPGEPAGVGEHLGGTRTTPGVIPSGPTRADARGQALAAHDTQRPDALIRHLVERPDHMVLIDVSAALALIRLGGPTGMGLVESQLFEEVNRWLAGALGDPGLARRLHLERVDHALLAFYGSGQGRTAILVAPAAILDTPPVDGGTATTLGGSARGAVRGGTLIAGQGPALIRALNPPSGAERFDPNATHAALWSHAPADAMLTLVSFRADRLPDAAAPLRALLERAEPTAAWVAFGLDGAVAVAVDAAAPDELARIVGRGQGLTHQSVGMLRTVAPRGMHGWVTYAALVHQTAWSRLTMQSHDSIRVFTMKPPDCGGPLRNVPVALFYLGAIEVASGSSESPDVAFVAMEAPTLPDCNVERTRPPSLPRDLARIGDQGSDVGFLVLADMSSVLSDTLPSFFGLLPTTLTSDAVETAHGHRPLGMDALDDPTGTIAYFVGPAGHLLMLHRGAATLAPSGGIGSLTPRSLRLQGLPFASPGIDVDARFAAPVEGPWVRGAASAPSDAYGAVIIGAGTLRAMTGGRSSTTPLGALIDEAGAFSIAWSARTGATFGVALNERSEIPATAVDDLIGLLTSSLAGLQTQAPLPRDIGDRVTSTLTEVLDGARVARTDGALRISFDDHALGSFVQALVGLGLPAMGGMLNVPALDILRVAPTIGPP